MAEQKLNSVQRELEDRRIRMDEINLKNAGKFKYKISEAGMYYLGWDKEGIIEADNADDALDAVYAIADDAGIKEEQIESGEYEIEIFKWIPMNYNYDGDWELVDFDKIDEIESLKDLEGKKLMEVKTVVKHEDKLKEIHLIFEGFDDIILKVDSDDEIGMIDILKLPF